MIGLDDLLTDHYKEEHKSAERIRQRDASNICSSDKNNDYNQTMKERVVSKLVDDCHEKAICFSFIFVIFFYFIYCLKKFIICRSMQWVMKLRFLYGGCEFLDAKYFVFTIFEMVCAF